MTLVCTMRSDPLPGLAGFLGGSRLNVEASEERVAEEQFQLKVVMPVTRGWYWLRSTNELVSGSCWPPLRLRFTMWNWIPYLRNAWYWRRARYWFVCSRTA